MPAGHQNLGSNGVTAHFLGHCEWHQALRYPGPGSGMIIHLVTSCLPEVGNNYLGQTEDLFESIQSHPIVGIHRPHGEKKEHGVGSEASWVLVLNWGSGVLIDFTLSFFLFGIRFPGFRSKF